MSITNEGVKIKNNVHLGYKAITPSDTVVVPAPHNDGFVVTVAGTVTFNTPDTSGDNLVLTFAAGDVWYVNLKLVLATGTTATVFGIRLNT